MYGESSLLGAQGPRCILSAQEGSRAEQAEMGTSLLNEEERFSWRGGTQQVGQGMEAGLCWDQEKKDLCSPQDFKRILSK